MSIEKTVSELALMFDVTRQAMNSRVKKFPEEYLSKNDSGVTVVNVAGIKELEKAYNKQVLEEEEVEPVIEDSMVQVLLKEKNREIERLYEQLKSKDVQISKKDEQLAIKDRQIAEKDKQLDQQQQLTAKAMADSEQYLLELHEAQEQSSQKQGFWSRLFGSKDS